MTTTSGQRPGAQTAAPRGTAAVVAPTAKATPVQKSRRTRLTIQRVDPWTVLRVSFLLSVAAAVVTVVAGLLLWGLLAAGGVFDSVDGTLDSVVGDGALTVTQYFGFGRVLSVSMLIAAIDVVLITALATIGAFLYNIVAGMVGGIEISVSEDF